jgi:hypothetical protein
MPPKGFRSLHEDTISVSTRVPLSLMPAIEAHTTRLRRQTPYLKVSQADALRDLLIRGLQSIDPHLNLFGEGEETRPPIGEAREQTRFVVGEVAPEPVVFRTASGGTEHPIEVRRPAPVVSGTEPAPKRKRR